MRILSFLSLSVFVCVMTATISEAAPPDKKPGATATVQPPAYYDSDGRLVGPAFPNGIVLIRIEELTAAIFVSYSGDYGDSGATWGVYSVMFSEPGCQGTAYIGKSYILPGMTGFGVPVLGLDGKVTMYVAPTASKTTAVYYSQIHNGVCKEFSPVGIGEVYLVTATMDLSVYKLPLWIK